MVSVKSWEKAFSVISAESWHAQKISCNQKDCTSLPAFLYIQCSPLCAPKDCCARGWFRVASQKSGSSSGCRHNTTPSFHLPTALDFPSVQHPHHHPIQGASSPSPPVLPSQPLLSLFALRASLGCTTFPCFHLSMIKCNSRQ